MISYCFLDVLTETSYPNNVYIVPNIVSVNTSRKQYDIMKTWSGVRCYWSKTGYIWSYQSYINHCIVSSWWPWFPSRNSVLIYMYIYIYVYIPYTSSVIGRIYNGSVIQYWRSCTPSRSIGECAVPDLNAILCFLWFTNCVLLFDNNLRLGCLWHCVFV